MKVPRIRDHKCKLCRKDYDLRLQSGGAGFEIAKYNASKYCSLECFHEARRRDAARRKRLDRKLCEQCGTPYGRNGRHPQAFAQSKFCSRECCSKSQENEHADVACNVEIDPATGCHNWMGQTITKGYGVVKMAGKMIMVHRVIWQQANGLIPEGLQIDHICRNTRCCNVEHLRVVTPGENTLGSNNMAARYARRENCDKCGGPFSYFPNGIRYCKPCRHETMMAYQRQYRAAKKAALLDEKEKNK